MHIMQKKIGVLMEIKRFMVSSTDIYNWVWEIWVEPTPDSV
jgi:hypothetical protein